MLCTLKEKCQITPVITSKSDDLNEVNSLCDYRFSIIIQGQENERKRCLQSSINKQETEYIRDAKEGTGPPHLNPPRCSKGT